MYAFVQGQLEEHGPPTVVSASGIGWEVWIPERLRRTLPAVGEFVRLYTHLLVREDDMSLYGFSTVLDREIFRALLSVNGVGPKVALAVLGDEGAEAVLRGIRRGDAKPLLSIKGIGKKTAERIVLELEDKAAAWVVAGGEAQDESKAARGAAGELDGTASEAVFALQALGVPPDKAASAVTAVIADDGDTHPDVESLLRAALRRLHPTR